MPEDLLVGFEFFTNDNGLSVVNDAAQRNAAEHLANDIAYFHAIGHLDTAISAVQTAAGRKARRDEPDLEDNVPPDLTGVDDFLL